MNIVLGTKDICDENCDENDWSAIPVLSSWSRKRKSMKPTLAWVQDSREQMDIVLKFIRSLDEGSLDLLGFRTINDRFSELFFPGISTIMTHARYYLFVPAMCLKVEYEEDVSGKEAEDKIEEYEDKICELLLNNGEEEGVIGRHVRSELVAYPSDTYWGSLRTLGIFNSSFSKSQYCKALRSLRQLRQEYDNQEQEGDGSQKHYWDPSIGNEVSVDISRPKSITLKLTQKEAEYLKKKFEAHDEQIECSLVAWLLQRRTAFPSNLEWEDISQIVEQSNSIDVKLKRQVAIATRYRLLAQLIEQLYYVYLSGAKWGTKSTKYSQAMDLLETSANNSVLKNHLRKSGTWLEEATRSDPFFLDVVHELIRCNLDPGELARSAYLVGRITERELNKKGPKARLSHKEVLEKWTTDNPLGNYPDFRRARGLQIIAEIRQGLYA